MSRIDQAEVETAINLSFTTEQLGKSIALMREWVAQETEAKRSKDLPTELHVNTINTIVDMVEYWLKDGSAHNLTAIKNLISRVMLDLDTVLLALDTVNMRLNMLSNYIPMEGTDEQETT